VGLNSSAIGTLVERTTRFDMLLHCLTCAGPYFALGLPWPLRGGAGCQRERERG
jgi:hypothetical protein